MPPQDQLFTNSETTERLKRWLLNSPRGYRLARRPYQLTRQALRVPHDPDYRAFRFLARPGATLLDIGANTGTSALSYSLFNRGPIVSLEANPNLRSDLLFTARLLRGRMRFLIAGAGSEFATLTFYVPYANGVAISAEGSFDRSKVESSESLEWRVGREGLTGVEIREQRVDVLPVDSLGITPDIVKLDVEGHEHEVLSGMQLTLARSKPILLIETPDSAVVDLLAAEGYTSHSYDAEADRLIAGSHGAVNTFFLTDSHSPNRSRSGVGTSV